MCWMWCTFFTVLLATALMHQVGVHHARTHTPSLHLPASGPVLLLLLLPLLLLLLHLDGTRSLCRRSLTLRLIRRCVLRWGWRWRLFSLLPGVLLAAAALLLAARRRRHLVGLGMGEHGTVVRAP